MVQPTPAPATLADPAPDRIARLLGQRDVAMADNLADAVARERGRGRVLAFAHNGHLQRGPMAWQLGAEHLVWWPAGAHLDLHFGPRYAAIGTAITAAPAHGITPAETGTLEAHLAAVPGPARWLATHRGRGLPTEAVTALPTRSGSASNSTYFPLTPRSLADFDWLLALDLPG